MCKDCGCGLPPEEGVRVSAHPHQQEHSHSHAEHHHHHAGDHEHDHEHHHEHEPGEHRHEGPRTVELRKAILDQNDRLAERNRGFFRARGMLVLNVLSSPGSGKTTLLRETLKACQQKLKAAVIVGDLATDNDAEKLRESGAPVVQVTTGTVCHLEAEMVAKAIGRLNLQEVGMLVIENVGNLVCPASYDLGEDLRVVLLSVTEGEDKPLKYPPMFQAAHVVVITKTDLAVACEFDREAALRNIARLAPQAVIFELSAKTGQGMGPWVEFLLQQHHRAKANPLSP